MINEKFRAHIIDAQIMKPFVKGTKLCDIVSKPDYIVNIIERENNGNLICELFHEKVKNALTINNTGINIIDKFVKGDITDRITFDCITVYEIKGYFIREKDDVVILELTAR